MKFLLVNGLYGIGKSTFSASLVRALSEIGVTALISPNASEVWKVCREVFDWNGVKDETARLLSWDVTKAGYNYEYHFWERKNFESLIKQVIEKGMTTPPDLVIVDDWRIMRTLEYFKRKGEEVYTLKLLPSENRNGFSYSRAVFSSELEPIPKDFDFTFTYQCEDTLEANDKLAREVASRLHSRLTT